MTRRSPKTFRQRLHSLYRWHRWLGVSASLFVLWLAVSGIALNHAGSWGLDQYLLEQGALHSHYGISVTPPMHGWPVGLDWVSEVDGQLWFNADWVASIPSPIVGAAQVGGLWFAAGSDWLILADAEGNLIEELGADALPHSIEAADSNGELIRLRGAGLHSIATTELNGWTAYTGLVTGTDAQILPGGMGQQIATMAAARYLSMDRLLRDLHSGRFFGPAGIFIMDAAAVIMIVLAITGLLLWLRYLGLGRGV